MLTEIEARAVVDDAMKNEGPMTTTQALLDAGAVPRLKGYVVRPGKVSDSIYGGPVSFKKKDGTKVQAENPPLNMPDGTPVRIMVRTAGISTHDKTRGFIPFKDQILAMNHNAMRKLLLPYIGTSQLDVPGLYDNDVVILAENLKQLGVEMVLRAYMAKSSTSTSLFQAYVVRGERVFAGHRLPEGLITNGPLPYVMDTPSTKSDEHDETLAPDELFKRGICTPQDYNAMRNGALMAMGVVTEYLHRKRIIAVDTKTEHGRNSKGQVVSQDEIWTMDSSRFWLTDDYWHQYELLNAGKIKELDPVSYSKEFARGFSIGDQKYTDDERSQIAVRYIQGIQLLLDRQFQADQRPRDERVISGLEAAVAALG
jgi:phosphoribosylaminoimidazole-succinocarboxamide synthase